MSADMKAVAAAREKLQRIQSEIEHVESGVLPVTKAEALAGVEAFVDDLAAGCVERVNSAAVSASRGEPMAQNFWGFSTPEVVASLLAWIDRDAIVKKLQSAVALLYADSITETLPAADRPKLIAKLRADFDAAELAEYELVEKAIAAGMNIAHRRDINPALLLGLKEPNV